MNDRWTWVLERSISAIDYSIACTLCPTCPFAIFAGSVGSKLIGLTFRIRQTVVWVVKGSAEGYGTTCPFGVAVLVLLTRLVTLVITILTAWHRSADCLWSAIKGLPTPTHFVTIRVTNTTCDV